VFFGPTEYAIARLVFRLREPTMLERQPLEQAWHMVARSAGIPADEYQLWIQDTKAVNALAASGHIIAVTRVTLKLPPHQLAAVLAHELGHHLGGHPWATLLSYWYSLPSRMAERATYWLYYYLSVACTGVLARLRVGIRPGCLAGALIVVLFPFFSMAVSAFVLLATNPLALLPLAIPVIMAWFNRYGEKYADRVAADLGYGPALLEVLYSWLNAGNDDARRQQGISANLFGSHPSCAERIHTLEKQLYQ